MKKVGIIGGAGYTAGELIRLLLNHPEVQIKSIQSSSHAGQNITDVHHDLLGETELTFSQNFNPDVDVVFLCSGHGKSKKFLDENIMPGTVKIIDLSTDFRIAEPTHDFVYGLPEKYSHTIAKANHVANPGCFATAIELACLPLSVSGYLQSELNITAITGSTGAGQAPSKTSHFSWKNNNISVYKAFEHQHLAEIKQLLMSASAHIPEINFIPVRGNFSRGIMALCTIDVPLAYDELQELYQQFYKKAPFVIVSTQNPDVKQVVNTNKCVLYLQKHNHKLLIISVIDNLLKGASGQAVQNMNIMFGLDEKLGLKLKPVAF